MGAVELTSKSLVAVMLGNPIPQRRIKALEKYVKPKEQLLGKINSYDDGPIQRIGRIADRENTSPSGTPNQIYMGAAVGLFVPSLNEAAMKQISHMMDREEREGPRPWELLCFDPHEGMYLLARMGVIAYGGELGLRAAKLLSQELRVADLIVAPDGNCVGLPGTRPPTGITSSRRALSHLWIEVRKRQGVEVSHRGTGGRVRDIKWDDDSDALVEGPAWWMRKLLDNNAFFSNAGDVKLIDILSRSANLPQCLRLGLTVYRNGFGTLAWLDDPGEANHKQYIITGSMASKRRKDKREAPVTWIRVSWNVNHKHAVEGGEAWESGPPTKVSTQKIFRIPGYAEAKGV